MNMAVQSRVTIRTVYVDERHSMSYSYAMNQHTFNGLKAAFPSA